VFKKPSLKRVAHITPVNSVHHFIPAGYLYKLVAKRPAWIGAAPHVCKIHSVSSCLSENFADYMAHWQHNGFWLFDSPAAMYVVAQAENVDLRPLTLFYYELHPFEFDETARSWTTFAPDGPVQVVPPKAKTLSGFDVCSFSQRNLPECSPLSCNSLCEDLAVNQNCLFDSIEAAKAALENGAFDQAEQGPFRIVAVYMVDSESET
jgi:hypothetical protein